MHSVHKMHSVENLLLLKDLLEHKLKKNYKYMTSVSKKCLY